MRWFKKKKTHVKIPLDLYLDTVGCLGLAPIYMLLNSEHEEAELGTEPEFKAYKWTGYEKEAAKEANRLYKLLLKEGTKQILSERN